MTELYCVRGHSENVWLAKSARGALARYRWKFGRHFRVRFVDLASAREAARAFSTPDRPGWAVRIHEATAEREESVGDEPKPDALKPEGR